MRYEVSVTEGDDERKQLVPLKTLLAIPGQFEGKSLNDLISDENLAPESWEPWVTWHAMKVRQDEKRAFDVWCDEIDWWSIASIGVETPSGDQETQTGAPSQSSSPAAPAPGPSSSGSTTTSSTPSGLSSQAA